MLRSNLIILCLFFILFNAKAADLTPEAKKAKNLVESALSYYKKYGKEKTFAEINNTKGKFVDEEYYIFVLDMDGVCLARGDGNAKRIGKNLIEEQDPNGKFYIKEMIKILKTTGWGWVDYKRTNPTVKKIENKSSYVKKVEGENFFFGCGFYKGN